MQGFKFRQRFAWPNSQAQHGIGQLGKPLRRRWLPLDWTLRRVTFEPHGLGQEGVVPLRWPFTHVQCRPSVRARTNRTCMHAPPEISVSLQHVWGSALLPQTICCLRLHAKP